MAASDVPFVIHSHGEYITERVFHAEHSHQTHELLWNADGAGSVLTGSARWLITAGLGLWIPAGVPHSGWSPARCISHTVHMSVDRVAPIATEPVAVELTPLLRLLLERLADPTLGSASREITEAQVIDLLTPAANQMRVQIPVSDMLTPIVENVLGEPSATVSLQEWSERLAVSTRTLTRAFRRHTGLGFADWVRSVRIEQAIPLVLDGAPLTEVAAATGYRSATAFGVAFRKVTGMTPSGFRTRCAA